MEVILLERISKLGQMGETVKVRDGFARNYLLPLGKALRANAANKARFEAERATLEARNLERKSEAQKVADVLNGKSFIVVRSAGALDLFNDIFAEGGARTTLLYTGGNPAQYLHVDHVMSMEIASLAQGSQVIQADPLFVDAAHGDYRLQPASPAIDLAPAITGDDFDLGGGPRDVDIAMTPNLDGVRDLGAYERQIGACYTSDTVYCDGFDP